MSNYIISVRDLDGNNFGNGRGAKASFITTNSDETYNKGNIINPDTWFKRILEQCKNTETKDILVFIHGYNNDIPTILKRHAKIQAQFSKRNFKCLTVSFDWPSGNNVLNYLGDRIDASITAINLVTDCILPFSVYQKPDCAVNVHLLAHSTGAYVIREAFGDADDRHIRSNWTASQIVFIAGDVSSNSLSADDPRTSSIFHHCIRFTNYFNPYDEVLKISSVKRANVAPRVGRVGLPEKRNAKSVDVNCGERYKQDYIDKKTDGLVASHSWYFDNDFFFEDLIYTLKGNIDRNYIPTRKFVANGKSELK